MLPFVVEKATLNTKIKLFVNLKMQMQQKQVKKAKTRLSASKGATDETEEEGV